MIVCLLIQLYSSHDVLPGVTRHFGPTSHTVLHISAFKDVHVQVPVQVPVLVQLQVQVQVEVQVQVQV